MAVSKVEGRTAQEKIYLSVLRDGGAGSTFVTEGTADIRGQKIPYRTVCEDVVFAGRDGAPVASMFAYSYFRTDGEAAAQAAAGRRPIVFAWNGGPGSSCIWIHVGMLGIKRIRCADPLHPSTVPPFEIEDNPHCLLDICDIVLIDPVATGFSKVWDEEGARAFYSVLGDAYSFTLLIEHWLTKYDRWNSPRILCGESYGTCRNAIMCGTMMIGGGNAKLIPISGMINMGTFYPMGIPGPSNYPEESVNFFTAMAATNWYYFPEGKEDLRGFVSKALTFAEDRYLRALYMGSRLSAKEREEILTGLEKYTGIPRTFYEKHHLRITLNEFRTNLLPGKNIGFYDGRFCMDDTDQMGRAEILPDDEAMGQFAVSYANVVNGQLRRFLGIDDGRPFTPVNDYINAKWDYSVYHTTTENLVAAMRRNRTLRVFYANGYYDLCTWTDATRHILSQLDLPAERITFREYEGGHMLYVGEEGAAPLEEDLRAFILSCVKKEQA